MLTVLVGVLVVVSRSGRLRCPSVDVTTESHVCRTGICLLTPVSSGHR